MTDLDQSMERRAWLDAIKKGDLISVRSPDGAFLQKVIRTTDDHILVVGRLSEVERHAIRFWRATGIMVGGTGQVYLEPLNSEQKASLRRGDMLGFLERTVWSLFDNETLEAVTALVAEAKTRIEFEKQFNAERRGGTQ